MPVTRFILSDVSILSTLLKSNSDPVIRKEGFITPKHSFLYTDFRQANRLVFPGNLVELSGIEPLTSCVQGRRSPN